MNRRGNFGADLRGGLNPHVEGRDDGMSISIFAFTSAVATWTRLVNVMLGDCGSVSVTSKLAGENALPAAASMESAPTAKPAVIFLIAEKLM